MSKKRIYNWIGGGQNIEPETDASTSVTEVIQLVPALPAADAQGQNTQALVEAIYLHFSVHRIFTDEIDAAGFVVWMANLQEGASALPVQSLDALSTQDRAYGNKAIMMMAPLPVPPVLGSSDLLSVATNEQVLVASHEYQARRKYDRMGQVLSMSVNCDVSVALSVFCQWRVLLSYGS